MPNMDTDADNRQQTVGTGDKLCEECGNVFDARDITCPICDGHGLPKTYSQNVPLQVTA